MCRGRWSRTTVGSLGPNISAFSAFHLQHVGFHPYVCSFMVTIWLLWLQTSRLCSGQGGGSVASLPLIWKSKNSQKIAAYMPLAWVLVYGTLQGTWRNRYPAFGWAHECLHQSHSLLTGTKGWIDFCKIVYSRYLEFLTPNWSFTVLVCILSDKPEANRKQKGDSKPRLVTLDIVPTIAEFVISPDVSCLY